MLSKISLTLIGSAAIVCMMIFLILLRYLNPYRKEVANLIKDHANTLHFGAYIDVYDLSLPQRTERLFLVRPENVVLYNTDGVLFYYLESSSVLCPGEFSIVRFTKTDIDAINSNGVYSTVCTNVNSLTILEHFVTLKNNVPDDRLLLTVDEINYSILDIINLLIYTGYVEIK
ncbi:occlusion-derived virus envelope protein 28 [Orgyia leucostigma nucleopolyhedrovirus]|uniref:Occlusion-derived virus envelope protein 28 n=1 Tax=Orgyia leucostigma nucleopolyhedrovirus TaxID=490711 RepID=B0FDV2_9ABAC|nr:occlusion-derived virus envelope protein 28 [Orgyia leucostigma nucleopolyhedrovirus]ABY65810.1 occlusion-derived virus envelope protein 28 [Orgyia leucostigma nucleopolyhedrovirus]